MSKTFIESLVGKRVRYAGEAPFGRRGWMEVNRVEEDEDGSFVVHFTDDSFDDNYDVDGKQRYKKHAPWDLIVHPDDADKSDELGALTDEEVKLIKQHREANKPPETRVVELYTDGDGKVFDEAYLTEFLFGGMRNGISRFWASTSAEGMRRKVRVTVEHLGYVEDGGE